MVIYVMNFVRRGTQLQRWHKCLNKRYATKSAATEQQKTTDCYDDVISRRQAEAKRSIIVQVNSEKSFPELYKYCNAFGSIVHAHHYCVQHEDEQHYILLEYAYHEEAAAAIDSSAYNDEMTGVPVRSPFLWFRARKNRALNATTTTDTLPALCTIGGTRALTYGEMNNILQAAPNLEAQIKLLHEHTRLNDLGVRLRFLAALQVQQALTGMFPAANAQPFGSSVNGFGKMGCDLDLILRFDRELPREAIKERHNSRLVFHIKENLSNGRSQTQRQMESIGDILQLFLPGVCHVRRILQARVPIIKYHHEHMNLEVDLSMSNL